MTEDIFEGALSFEQVRMRGFHLCSTPLKAGSVVLPGNWGRIISLIGERHDQHRRESFMEEIRQQHFPDKPSRMRSTFYCTTFETALWFQQVATPVSLIYEVVPVNPAAPWHVGYLNILPGTKGLEWEEAGYSYWRRDIRGFINERPDIVPDEVVIESLC